MQSVRFLLPSEQGWKSVMRSVMTAGFRVEDTVQLALLKDLKKAVKRLDDGGSVSDMPDDPRLLGNFDTAYPNAEDPPVTW